MDFLEQTALRPLLRLLAESFRAHRAEIAAHDEARTFDRASLARLAEKGFFHATDLARAESPEGAQAHWPLLSQFFEEAARELMDFPFAWALALHGGVAIELLQDFRGISEEERGDLLEGRLLCSIAHEEGRPVRGPEDLHTAYRNGLVYGRKPWAPNAPHAGLYLVSARSQRAGGEKIEFLTLRRQAELKAEDLSGALGGLWNGSNGSLFFRGLPFAAEDFLPAGSLRVYESLSSLLFLSITLGILRGMEEDCAHLRGNMFPVFRARTLLEGVVAQVRTALLRGGVEADPLLRVGRELCNRELSLAAEAWVALAGEDAVFGNHPARKMLRDLQQFRALEALRGTAVDPEEEAA